MLPTSIVTLVTIHTPGCRETMWSKISCLRKQHNSRDQAWTTRPPHLNTYSVSAPKLWNDIPETIKCSVDLTLSSVILKLIFLSVILMNDYVWLLFYFLPWLWSALELLDRVLYKLSFIIIIINHHINPACMAGARKEGKGGFWACTFTHRESAEHEDRRSCSPSLYVLHTCSKSSLPLPFLAHVAHRLIQILK